MNRNIIVTSDGSNTLQIPGMNVTYHSVHGAIQESMHVFIEAGFRYYISREHGMPIDKPVKIFEMGFGTGLNALLTAKEAAATKAIVHYSAIEKFPVSRDEFSNLNYCQLLQMDSCSTIFK